MDVHNQFDQREWLETNGLGGFASGTVSGIRTRRYHALLLAATTPPTGRLVLVNGLETWVACENKSFELSAQFYQPDVVHPPGHQRIESFHCDPWPRWIFRLENGLVIQQEIFLPHETASVAIRWVVLHRPPEIPRDSIRLYVRPLMSGRDYHSLQHENNGFVFSGIDYGSRVAWNPYHNLPGVSATSNGRYCHEPVWYRNFLYTEEQQRGLDCAEDLASPGLFEWKLDREEAVLILDALGVPGERTSKAKNALRQFQQLALVEKKRREQMGDRQEQAADQYLVRRFPKTGNTNLKVSGKTIVAGYPWFTDWGRDTFIALRGLCIANGRLDVARDILLQWSTVVSEGMLPNLFPDHGNLPEYNSVDASLWYIIAAWEFLEAADTNQFPVSAVERSRIASAIVEIVDGHIRGTRFGIRVDDDGLLFAGQSGVQLTWMDAKVGDWVVTPRIGKPVEVQALWLNALWIVQQLETGELIEPNTNVSALLKTGRDSFLERFWNVGGGYLFDVVDVNFEAGKSDDSFRPNQIFAIGGLPMALIDGKRARQVVDAVESRLLAPLGLRSLDQNHPDYKPFYSGDVWLRDGAYHQGTVWPWLMGPFVEAWLRVREHSDEAREEAEQRFIAPLLAHLDQFGINHISEITDAEPEFTGRGCPFQAWSLGELIRLQKSVLRSSESREVVSASFDYQMS